MRDVRRSTHPDSHLCGIGALRRHRCGGAGSVDRHLTERTERIVEGKPVAVKRSCDARTDIVRAHDC